MAWTHRVRVTHSFVTVFRSLRAAAASTEGVSDDVLCLNPGQNIMVASTPMIENAKRYSSIKKIHIGNNAYAMMTCTRRRSRTHRKAWFTTSPTKTHKKTSREVWSTRRIPQFSRRDEWVIQARSSSSLKGPECRTTCTTTARNISAFCTRKR